MRMHLVTIVHALFLLLMNSVAQAEVLPNGRQVLSRFELRTNSDQVLRELSKKYEILHRHGDAFEFLAPKSSTDAVMKEFSEAKLLAEDDFLDEIRKSGFSSPEKIAGYRSIDQVYEYMTTLAGMNPSIVRLTQYGTSGRGRPLYALKLSDHVGQDEEEPEIMLTSATHGDELITVEMLLGLLDELVKGYGKDQRLTKMIQDHELFFIPVVNADGFATQSRYSNGVDPNRNFPWPENQNVQSEATARNIMQFFEERNFVGSIDFHASGEMIMYPWAYTYNSPAAEDERRFKAIGQSMAAQNRYDVGQISKIIYIAQGSSADFWYWNKSTIAFGIEIAQSKVPSASSIPGIITDNRESTWKFIESFE
jgi:carboxypeptidase T